MGTIKELDELVKYRMDKELNTVPNHNKVFRLDHLFPEEGALEEFSDSAILIITRKYNMLLPSCIECRAVRPNGKWMPRTGWVAALLNKYGNLSHGYCDTCLINKYGVNPEEISIIEETLSSKQAGNKRT